MCLGRALDDCHHSIDTQELFKDATCENPSLENVENAEEKNTKTECTDLKFEVRVRLIVRLRFWSGGHYGLHVSKDF